MIATPMTLEELKALEQRRDSTLLWWELSAEELARAYAAGMRNFHGANLDGANLVRANLYGANLYGANLYGANLDGANLGGANLGGANLGGANLDGANLGGANLGGANLGGANLDGANLGGANLYGANLLNAPGIYSVYSPFLSSRGAALEAGIVLESGELHLRFSAGCKKNRTADELRELVSETHCDNIHAKHYALAISFIEATFAVDMEAGRWEYLKDWKPANNDEVADAPLHERV